MLVLDKYSQNQDLITIYKTFSSGIHFKHSRGFADRWYCQSSIKNCLMSDNSHAFVGIYPQKKNVYCKPGKQY